MIREQDLSEAQQTIVNALRGGIRFCAGNTGVGKTISTLYAFPDVKTILVITEKTLRDLKGWQIDLEQTERSDISITHISKEDMKKQYETLPAFDCVVADEACKWLLSGVRPQQRSHRGMPYIDTSQTYEAVYEYLLRTNPKYVLLIDATPTANKPLALWAAMDILGLRTRPRLVSHEAFVNDFYIPIPKGYTNIWKEKTIPSRFVSESLAEQTQNRLVELWKKIAVFVDDDAKIPPIEEDIYVPMSPHVHETLKQIEREYAGNPSIHARLFAAENGHRSYIKFDDERHSMKAVRSSVCSDKIQAVIDLIQTKRPPHGAIIFATFTKQQEAMVEALVLNGISARMLNGQTKSEDRKDMLDQFNRGEIQVIVVQSSICEGYNAPNCDTIIRLSPPMRAASLEQQYGRINRKSNYKQNYIYNIILKSPTKKPSIDETAFARVKVGDNLNDLVYEDED